MNAETIIICLFLSLVEGITQINDEFNTKIFDDDMEYGLIDNVDDFPDGTEHFYRQIRSLEEDYRNVETVDTEEYYRRLPISDFARKLRQINDMYDDGNDVDEYEQRFRRSAQNADKEEVQQLVDNGEKPLEVLVLDLSKNDTKYGIDANDLNQLNLTDGEEESLRINDFIRFRRDLSNNTNASDDDKSRSKREKDENGAKRDAGFKEQWVRQPYPVARSIERPSEDNFRSPRVNFVTQRRSESAPYPVYYDSNNRYRDFPEDYENYSRFPRHYQSDPYRRNYYRDEVPRYPVSPSPYNENYYDTRPVYKQRRIIYYATLPEVVRSPAPSGDLGDRYNYRDFYETDSRYGGVPLQNVGRGDPYRFRKPLPLDKSRYDEGGSVKGPYPLKVSTDVNVKEIKKSPERRIFSEGDQRYGRGPYQPLERY